MERAIRESRKTLIILSPDYLVREWKQLNELLISIPEEEKNKWRNIPLILKSCALPDRLSFLVPVDLTESDNDEWTRLIKNLKPFNSIEEKISDLIRIEFDGTLNVNLEAVLNTLANFMDIDKVPHYTLEYNISNKVFDIRLPRYFVLKITNMAKSTDGFKFLYDLGIVSIQDLSGYIKIKNLSGKSNDKSSKYLLAEVPEGYPSLPDTFDSYSISNNTRPLQDSSQSSLQDLPFSVPPAIIKNIESENVNPRRMTIILKPSNNSEKDVRRLKRIHRTLVSYPGNDKFALLVFEQGRRFTLEFPHDTIRINNELVRQLIEIVGEGNISIDQITLQ